MAKKLSSQTTFENHIECFFNVCYAYTYIIHIYILAYQTSITLLSTLFNAHIYTIYLPTRPLFLRGVFSSTSRRDDHEAARLVPGNDGPSTSTWEICKVHQVLIQLYLLNILLPTTINLVRATSCFGVRTFKVPIATPCSWYIYKKSSPYFLRHLHLP